MPSRQLPPDSGSPRSSGGNFPLIPVLCAGAAAAAFIATFLLVLFCRKRRSKSSSYPNLRRFSHREISHSTGGFSTENKLGQGGFGSVYHGVLGKKGEPVAVKLMDPGSLQGEREFQNELVLAGKLAGCERVVSLLGFCSDNRKNRILIYELMQNRSLQDVLFDRRCVRLLNWRVRFEIAVDVAKGIEFMHTRDPPIIHGDVKPSNVLLDLNFRAKIGDFGLAKLKSEIESPPEAAVIEPRKKKRKKKRRQQDEFSVDTEMESYSNSTPGPSPENLGSILFSPEAGELSPENCASEAAVEGCPLELMEKTSIVSEGGCLDKTSVDSGSLRRGGGSCRKSVRDSWWRQDANSESGMKDYVMEWIGSEISRERRLLSGNRGGGGGGSVQSNEAGEGTPSKRKKARKLEWLVAHSSDDKRKKERNPAREWWREEFCDELTRKSRAKRKKRRKEERWWEWEGSDSENVHRPKHRNLSGEFRLGRHNHCADISSTPSMRGTVCYVAPEYGGGGILSEKSDVYSYGVLLLVIVSGRRPLQVTASPMAQFEKSNLISWSRQLALAGKLPELVDPNLQAVDFEQALLCIKVALLCLQRSPSRRPTISEVVKMLNGETELLHLPVEFSPSPPLCVSKTKNSVKRAPARTSGSHEQQERAPPAPSEF